MPLHWGLCAPMVLFLCGTVMSERARDAARQTRDTGFGFGFMQRMLQVTVSCPVCRSNLQQAGVLADRCILQVI